MAELVNRGGLAVNRDQDPLPTGYDADAGTDSGHGHLFGSALDAICGDSGQQAARYVAEVIKAGLPVKSFEDTYELFCRAWFSLGAGCAFVETAAKGILFSRATSSDVLCATLRRMPASHLLSELCGWLNEYRNDLKQHGPLPALAAGVAHRGKSLGNRIRAFHAILRSFPEVLHDGRRIPVVYVQPTDSGQRGSWRFSCICGAEHSHGPGEGFHVAPCPRWTPFTAYGYFIKTDPVLAGVTAS